MKTFAAVVLVVLVAGLAGCSVGMGNMKLGLLEGWNQPTTTQKTVETTAPVVK